MKRVMALTGMTARRVVAGMVLAGVLAVASPARALVESYPDCMALAQLDPPAGYEAAQSWQARGGGFGARHCAAIALLMQDRFAEAATRLETLVADMDDGDPLLKADILAQAAQSLSVIGDLDKALELQTRALKLAPEDVELLLERSVTLAAMGRHWEAIDDLNLALELDPYRSEALVLRASNYRFVGGLELARDDVNRAIELDPHFPEAWLERGILRRQMGDNAGARAAWTRVISMDPDSPAAIAAQDNIDQLQVTEN